MGKVENGLKKGKRLKGEIGKTVAHFLNFEVFCGGGTNLWGVSEYVILGISVCFLAYFRLALYSQTNQKALFHVDFYEYDKLKKNLFI